MTAVPYQAPIKAANGGKTTALVETASPPQPFTIKDALPNRNATASTESQQTGNVAEKNTSIKDQEAGTGKTTAPTDVELPPSVEPT